MTARLKGRECLHCSLAYDTLEWPNGEGIVMDTEEEGLLNELPCPGCGGTEHVYRMPIPAKPVNRTRGIQVGGDTFSSARELEKFAEARGLEIMDTSSTAWRNKKLAMEERHSKVAQKDGFDTLHEKHLHSKKHRRDYVAAAREKQIATYHERYGNEGKQTVEKAFGALPTNEG